MLRRSLPAALATLLAATAIVALPTPASAEAPTQPSTETARSLYMNNWSDTSAIWMDSKLARTDHNTRWGPRLAELHYSPSGASSASAVNQIVDYTGFFRDETNGITYDQVHQFGSATGYLDSGGILRTDYGDYAGTPTTVRIGRDYTMVPNRHFIVVTYRLTDTGDSDITMNVLDSVHLNNTGKVSGKLVRATYDSARDADVVDMSASGQYHLVLGSLDGSTGHQVGDDTNSDTSSPTVAPWYAFDAGGVLPGNDSVAAADVSVALSKQVLVPAHQTVRTSFYLAIDDSTSAVLSDADTARAHTGGYWQQQTSGAYSDWLSSGRRASFGDSGLSTAYDRALVVMKQTQNPVLGTWPATTNPIAYRYKTWVRDSAVTAMALDAAGHHAEAAKYFYWLAGAQYGSGAFGTTYNSWTGQHVPFVEPENDSIGIFLIGVLRHYRQTGDTAFLDAMWPHVRSAAGFVANNLAGNGFGPADASIWEEAQAYNTFTQALYIAGLRAAQQIAHIQGDTANMAAWADAAAGIDGALQRSSLDSPAGLWNAPDGYYNRSVKTDSTGDPLVDSSTDIVLVLGIVDPNSSRAASHVAMVEAQLRHDTWGIARYQGDTFYYTSQYSPAGNEALGPEPSWPQMSMYLAIDETYVGDDADALSRLRWYASRTAVGYMPPGEAVSNVTHKPIVSTMVEPVTAAWYVLAALTETGQYDLRVPAPAR